mmetsp:Transcript_19268/g.37507  ORF Transcript_19268/g.37507 Transcript_19268/m.37507 type:complete len:206 (-) Transcript_19268:799-1416(-)
MRRACQLLHRINLVVKKLSNHLLHRGIATPQHLPERMQGFEPRLPLLCEQLREQQPLQQPPPVGARRQRITQLLELVLAWNGSHPPRARDLLHKVLLPRSGFDTHSRRLGRRRSGGRIGAKWGGRIPHWSALLRRRRRGAAAAPCLVYLTAAAHALVRRAACDFVLEGGEAGRKHIRRLAACLHRKVHRSRPLLRRRGVTKAAHP